jgi:hypothetical protein
LDVISAVFNGLDSALTRIIYVPRIAIQTIALVTRMARFYTKLLAPVSKGVSTAFTCDGLVVMGAKPDEASH